MAGKVLTIDKSEVDVDVKDQNECPECGGKLVRLEGCKMCRDCRTRLC